LTSLFKLSHKAKLKSLLTLIILSLLKLAYTDLITLSKCPSITNLGFFGSFKLKPKICPVSRDTKTDYLFPTTEYIIGGHNIYYYNFEVISPILTDFIGNFFCKSQYIIWQSNPPVTQMGV
jgi:hypothetical protein